jgi:hypothetical protein
MGGTLRAAPAGARPSFMIQAARDPKSGNLDRIQVVKGWVDASGEKHEAVFDAAWSGERVPDPATGALPPVGDTVEVAEATYANTVGSPELSAVWTDPAFDPALHAFYYVRVLEIPTPRWSTRDAAKLGLAIPAGLPPTLQERAWSSPIWYAPG